VVEGVGDGEETLFFRHGGVEDYLEGEVAQFFGEVGPVLAIDGVEDFVGFLEGVGLDGVEGLFAVPGAASGGAEAGHDFDEALESFSRGGTARGVHGRGKFQFNN
jgi:hypothetical protein